MPAMEGQLKKRGAKMPVMHDRYCVATWEINHSTFDKYVLLRSFKTQKGYLEQPAKPSSACTLKSVTDWNGKTKFHHYDHAFQMESTDGQIYFCVAPTALEKSQWLEFMTTGRSYRSNSSAELRQYVRSNSNTELRQLGRSSSSAELRQFGRSSSNAELWQLVRTSSNTGSLRSNTPFLDQVWRGPGSVRKYSSSGLVIARKESDVSTDGEFSMNEDVESCKSFKADSVDDIEDVATVAESSNQGKGTRELVEDVSQRQRLEDASSGDVVTARSSTGVSGEFNRGKEEVIVAGTAAIEPHSIEDGAENEVTSSKSGADARVESSNPEPDSNVPVFNIGVESPRALFAESVRDDKPSPKKVVGQVVRPQQREFHQTPNSILTEASVPVPTRVASDKEPAIEAALKLLLPVVNNAEADGTSSTASSPASPNALESTTPIPRSLKEEVGVAAPPSKPHASGVENPRCCLSRPAICPSSEATASPPSVTITIEPASRERSTSLPTAIPSSVSGRKLVRIGSASTMSVINEDSTDESADAWLLLATRARAHTSVVPHTHENLPSLTRERLRRHSFGSVYTPSTPAAQMFVRTTSVKPSFIKPRLGYVHSGLSTIVPSFEWHFTSLSRQQQSHKTESKASKLDDDDQTGMKVMDQALVIDEV